jgi:biopolymer transport protein ExbB/TolQ
MALFTVLVVMCAVIFRSELLGMAMNNIWINGIIIGTTIFGMGSCFADMFRLVPEYGWLKRYFAGRSNGGLPPFILRSLAIVLNRSRANGIRMQPSALNSFLEIIISRFEDQRETTRYITNTLIFIGLLGTFWGLIHTVGGFASLINDLDFADDAIMATMQSGLATPLKGIGTAFSSSLFGLAGSLIVGFLGMQVQMAQNTIFRELEENLSERTALS